MPRIPLIEDLTNEPIPAGSQLMVEFDPSSQWYNASLTIASGWLKSGGTVNYNAFAQPPNEIRDQLNRLGLDVPQLENAEALQITDWYTATLGKKSEEKWAMDSLRIHDASIAFATDSMKGPPRPEMIVIADNQSVFARFNEEKTWIEFHLTRTIPGLKSRRITAIRGVIRDIHSTWIYRQLEAAVDGVVDFKLDETVDPPQNLMRIRTMRHVGYEGQWRKLNIGQNFEITLEK